MTVTREQFEEVHRRLDAGEFDTKDFHRATAAYVLGIPSTEVTSEQRAAAKAANYFHMYF